MLTIFASELFATLRVLLGDFINYMKLHDVFIYLRLIA